MFPEAAELKDELRTRMLQARTREGAEPSDMRDSTHPREAATPLDPGLALLGPREGLALPTEALALPTEAIAEVESGEFILFLLRKNFITEFFLKKNPAK
jgi:hypothetical protein